MEHEEKKKWHTEQSQTGACMPSGPMEEKEEVLFCAYRKDMEITLIDVCRKGNALDRLASV